MDRIVRVVFVVVAVVAIFGGCGTLQGVPGDPDAAAAPPSLDGAPPPLLDAAGSDASHGPGCPTGAFDTSFDPPEAPPTFGWDMATPTGLATSSAVFFSPPNSLRAASATARDAYLECTFVPIRRLTITFVLRIDNVPALGTGSVHPIEIACSAVSTAVVKIAPGGAVSFSAPGQLDKPAGTFGGGGWYAVTLDLPLDGSGNAMLTTGPLSGPGQTVNAQQPVPACNVGPRVRLGAILESSPASPPDYAWFIDNVVVAASP